MGNNRLHTLSLLLVLGLGLIISLAGGCTKGMVKDQAERAVQGDEYTPTVSIGAFDYSPADVANLVTPAVARGEGGYQVVVTTAADLKDTSELYFKVLYDPVANHAYGIKTGDVAATGMLAMAIEAVPGEIHVGLVKAGGEIPTGTSPFTAGGELVTFNLLPGAAERSASTVEGGAPTSNRARARNLMLTKNSEDRWELTWDYTNPGDNNQDGLVGINDLTGIGQHYLANIGDSWSDPFRHIDSNLDGIVNMSDITAIGQNFNVELFSYKIEMFDTERQEWITVGELLLGDQTTPPGETISFTYEFGQQYVDMAWYRVAPLSRDLEFGAASEAINEEGRMLAETDVPAGQTVTVTVYACDLPYPITHMNAVRVVYPDGFTFVRKSANAGTPGLAASDSDGIWETFAPNLIFAGDSFYIEEDLGNGKRAIDFNVTTITPSPPGAPVGYGDLVNFKLLSDGSDPLTLEFQPISYDGLRRCYYTDSSREEHDFANYAGFRIE